MARIARVVVPNVAHHVTQRGNRRQQVFFYDDDYRKYKLLLSEYCSQNSVEVMAYCLMPNHVHLILVPTTLDGLRSAVGETHRRYTRYINFREGWRGYLWQGRFASFPMDEHHLWAAIRYVELNPVRARLCKRPQDWSWSSAMAHITSKFDGLVDGANLAKQQSDWFDFLSTHMEEDTYDQIRSFERTGRPMGSKNFIRSVEQRVGRSLQKKKPGRKPKPNI